MEGKLIKTGEQFLLRNKEDEVIAITSGTMEGGMLSLKNCEAIANGYDLVELFDEVDESIDYQEFDFSSFKLGFKKAIELLGDKKFSEKDMSKAWSEGYHRKVDELNGNGLRYFDKFIQSLQQTEWNVEVEMEDTFIKNSDQYIDEVGVGNYSTHSKKPKLDENGCLILKRK
jgi:hypothetical protein